VPLRGLLQQLRRDGFDRTTYDRAEKAYTPRCSQCEVLVINGIACHETGCPNDVDVDTDDDE
jgi:hypothetical protein